MGKVDELNSFYSMNLKWSKKMIDEPFKTKCFSIDSLTKFRCPECNIGLLQARKENIVDFKHKKHNELSLPDYDHENDFCGFLQCNNSTCHEKIVVAGKILLEGITTEKSKIVKKYSPLHFSRPPHVIEILPEYPEEIKKILLDSFSLFWLDKAACVNKIRICIEDILDAFNVEKINSKGKFTVSDRIAGNNDDLRAALLAMKWIGNEGSHSVINVYNLLDAYAVINSLLKELFKNRKQVIDKLSAEIDRAKVRNTELGKAKIRILV